MTAVPTPAGRMVGFHRRTFARRETPLVLALVQCIDCHRLIPPDPAWRSRVTGEWRCRDRHDCRRAVRLGLVGG